MPQIERTTVNRLIQEGYRFELGDYISDGFKVFTSQWLLFSLYALVSFFILALSVVSVVGLIFLIYPVVLGFAVGADKLEETGELRFSDFFGAFKNFGSFALVGLILILSLVMIYGPIIFWILYIENSRITDSNLIFTGFIGIFGYMVLVALFICFIQIGLFFAPYLIHYGGYKAGEAISASFRLAFKNFWWLLVFVFISGIIAGIGQYLCLIGLFASLSVSALINYSLVRKILINKEFNEIDEIGKTT